jgi:hypothetical protein
MRSTLALLAIALAAAPVARANRPLPPISYVCPMAGDEDVIEDQPGACRKCGMELQPIRLDSVWTCPVHAAVIKDAPGRCPIDVRDLVQVTVSISWSCPNSNVESISPGTCADGSPMVKKYAPRPHGNHNPQHGGQFFMAPDNWHHLEGTYPRAGIFRLYLYDDFTKPLARDQVRKVAGTAVLQVADSAMRATKDGTSFTLVPAGRGQYLEARIGNVSFPVQLAAKLKFQAAAPEHRFDFTFTSYSKEPLARIAPRITTNGAQDGRRSTPAAQDAAPAQNTVLSAAGAGSPSAASAALTTSGLDPGLIPLPIPETIPEMVAQLTQRTEQIRRFIDQGSFASLYVPAFQAKDVALALDEHSHELPPERRKIAEPAIKRLVRSAWLLDAFGDIGNKERITQAFMQFAVAVKEVEAAYAEVQSR